MLIADPGLEPVLCDRCPHLGGGPDGAQRVVLVRYGDAEHRHDRVADELLDRAAVPLQDDAEILEVPPHAGAERLRVGRLPERGRADEVAEEHGDDLALLAGGLGSGERGSARTAEARVVGVPATAARTVRHPRSLRGPCGVEIVERGSGACG